MVTERVAFKIFSIIYHTERWLPRRQMEIQTKGLCGEREAGQGQFGEKAKDVQKVNKSGS